MIKLRFLMAFGGYSKGAIIEPAAMLRQQLLATRWYGQRVVEVVEEPAPVPPPEPELTPAPAGNSARQRKRATL